MQVNARGVAIKVENYLLVSKQFTAIVMKIMKEIQWHASQKKKKHFRLLGKKSAEKCFHVEISQVTFYW